MLNESEENVFVNLLKHLGVFCCSLAVLAIRTFVLMCLFNWFISEPFNTMQVSILQAFGILVVIGFLQLKVDKVDIEELKEPIKDNFKRVLYKAIISIVFLGFFYGIHLLM